MSLLPFNLQPTYFYVITFLFLFLSNYSNAQISCGTEATSAQAFPLQLLSDNTTSYLDADSITFLAVKIHVVQDTSSASSLEVADILEEIEEANAFFKQANLQFYIHDSINYINDSNLYTYEIATDEFTLRAYAEPNVINIYFVGTINASSTPFGAYTYLPPGPDIIFMSQASTLFNKATLAHELGHYLGLYHTHGLSNTFLTNELVDGSNCLWAGDRICDTPADPNLLNSVDANCAYTGNLTDANGERFMPDSKNIMSYAFDRCTEYFTEGQFNRMVEILNLYRSNIISYKEEIEKNTFSLKLEIEDSFQVIDERGNKSAIGVFGDYITDNNEGKAVTLFDLGDKLGMNFQVSNAGDYILKVRLRSGSPNRPTTYWPDGYLFALNNEPIELIGNEESVSPLYTAFGGAHWGTMESDTIALAEGNYSFSIASNSNWVAVDYLVIEEINTNSIPSAIALSNVAIEENNEIGDFIGKLSAEDNDSGDTHQFLLVAGEGDAHNTNFFISNDSLFSNKVFDYEETTEQTIRIQVNDGRGGTYEKNINISILNVYDSFVSFSLFNLNQVYDSLPKEVSITSTPANVAYKVTYNGTDTLPINAGKYFVKVTSTNPEYTGEILDTLIINKAESIIEITDLEHEYDEQPKLISISTIPQGLHYNITYLNMDSPLPIAVGKYDIHVTINDQNYSGEANAQLVINEKTQVDTTSTTQANLRIKEDESLEINSEEDFSNQLMVYPNPTNGIFAIEGFSSESTTISIKVFDAQGRLVKSEIKSGVNNQLRIDLTGNPSGTYSVNIKNGKETAVLKVSKL